MRIAVWHNLPSGGGKRALYQHVKGLIERGHEVECWCPAEDGSYLPLGALAREHVVALQPVPALRWPWNRLPVYHGWKGQFEALDGHCRTCAEQIDAGGFDVLFSGNCIRSAVSPIARHVQLPSLLYHGEPKRGLYEANPSLPWLAAPEDKSAVPVSRRVKEWLRDHDMITALRVEAREERASAAAFDLLLANSSFSRESILRAYGLDSKVCYLGIDAGLFRLGAPIRENYAVGLGGVQPHKGLETAVEALAAVPPSRRPALVWVGNLVDAEYRAAVLLLAERCGVALTIKNLISDQELVDCLGRAALMIYTSKLEPFGFAPLEANACGTPVVAVAEGGVRETVLHHVNGLLTPDRDPAALGRAVLHLLDEPELARRLGETGARQVRERWTWEKSVAELERHLLSLVNAGEPPREPAVSPLIPPVTTGLVR